MAKMLRRDFLKSIGLAAVVVTGVSVGTNRPDYSTEPEKKKVIGDLMQGVITQKERYQKAKEMSWDSLTLMCAMMDDKHLWDDALPGQDYIVGVAEGREQGILRGSKHYFSEGETCGEFIAQCAKEGKAFHCDSRNKPYFC